MVVVAFVIIRATIIKGAEMDFYQMAFYFLLYAFIGWIIEVVYHAVTLGKVVNRGMLNGPVCPIYGCGVLGAFLLAGWSANTVFHVEPDRLSGILIFVVGMVLCTAIELVTGYLLDLIFHMRWWDYRSKPFNLKGYICLEFSIIWGLALVFVIKILYPTPENNILRFLPRIPVVIMLIVFYIVFVLDLVITVMTIRKMQNGLGELAEVQKRLHSLSDELSERIGQDTLKNMQKWDEGVLQAALAKAELRDALSAAEKQHISEMFKMRSELESNARKLIANIEKHDWFGTGRFIKAFPALRDNTIGLIRDLLRENNLI